MKFQAIIVALVSAISVSMAAPLPQSKSVPAKENSGGRVVLDGAQCSPVQGRLVCDDGFGNTFLGDADEFTGLALDVNAFGDGAVLGCDFAGEVFETHPSATKFRKGSRIAGFVWGGEIPGLGAYSTYTIADERLSFEIPDNIGSAEASSIPLAATTAWLALFSPDCLGLAKHQDAKKTPLLIWGGSSVVGHFAIQLAKMYGYEVVTTCSPRNFNQAKLSGASHVFDYNDEHVTEKIRASVPELKYAFDTIGNRTSSATAATALQGQAGHLCTVRPGKANTENVPSTVHVSDVFVFTAFPTAHTYRGKAHWPINMPNHEMSVEFHNQIPGLLSEGNLKPPAIDVLGNLSPEVIEEAMNINRDGKISGQKVVFTGFE
ncbi:zinc-binding oxidoreductase [Colletotrichum karsti]|uniref:Zinc-binding oxidoreductase n=1 Tax=Colletotrichum karsti TaxID=1095194 RepID=A0A9P6LDP7_9PEZI|nr:zinc-binding oxidoreductase [Colletotrichum karsti]KAF9872129.1 zinc-binding oxidoreductase [Colletotrichum karsti]